MVRNINNMDKIVRVGLAVVLALLGYFVFQPQFGLWGLVVPVVVGLILVATVFLNFCPIYRMIGFSTCPDGQC